MKIYRYIHIIIFLFVAIMSVSAQQYSQISLPNQGLLPVSHITNVLQDSEGYFWYATPGGGLCRDNGYQIDVIRNDRNHPMMIANNDIMGITEVVARKSIVFSTWAGIYELSKKDYSLRHICGRGSLPAFSIATDRMGQLWACGFDSVFIYNKDLRLAKRFRLPYGCSGTQVHFQKTNDGTLWAFADGRMYKAEEHKLTLVTLPSSYAAYGIVQDKRGHYYIGTNKGIVEVDFQRANVRIISTLVNEGVSNIAIDLQDNIWAITQGNGLTSQEKKIIKFPAYGSLRNGNNKDAASTIFVFQKHQDLTDGLYVDHDNNVWVYGQSPHTFILSPYNRGVVNEGASFASMPTSIYCQMTDGPWIWAWQWRKPLVAYNRQNGQIIDVQRSCTTKGTLGFAFSRSLSGGIWDGTNSGEVVRLRTDGGSVKCDIAVKVDSRIVATAETSDHKLFIGTEHNLYLYDLTTKRLKLVKKEIGAVTQMQPSSDGWGYFTIEANGLGRVNGNGHCEQMLKGMILTDVIEDARKQMWIAAKDGSVYKYDKKTQQLAEDTLAGNENGDIIYMMEADRRGHIWILSDQQLKEYNPKTHALRIFRCTDPDINMDCFQNICLTDGMMCLAGLGGYRLIKPSAELDRSTSDNIHPALSGYKINGETHFAGYDLKEIKLKPSDTDVKFYFTSFNITERNHIRFACKLEGWDKEWQTLPEGQNNIQYINLGHGEYKLLLKATDAYGRWSKTVQLLTVNRLPAWYETWWFRTALCLFIAAIFGYAIRFIMRRNFHRRVFLNSDEEQQKKLIPLNKDDEEFVEKVHHAVEKHLSDEGFNVEQLSSEMCMSRMNLYRRMQTIIGQSPSAYIRSMRLKRAAELIKEHKAPLSEIATMTGFSSPAYFSKCFHDMYGVPPSQY